MSCIECFLYVSGNGNLAVGCFVWMMITCDYDGDDFYYLQFVYYLCCFNSSNDDIDCSYDAIFVLLYS